MPLIGATGQTVGSVRAWQTAGGVTFHVEATGLPHGVHGIHVHSVGRCDAPDFTSAGSHWNPLARKHGLSNPQGPHAGDMPNFTVDASGRSSATIVAPGVTLSDGPHSVFTSGGTALVIHEKADDLMTDPAGNAGARVACGVIRK